MNLLDCLQCRLLSKIVWRIICDEFLCGFGLYFIGHALLVCLPSRKSCLLVWGVMGWVDVFSCSISACTVLAYWLKFKWLLVDDFHWSVFGVLDVPIAFCF